MKSWTATAHSALSTAMAWLMITVLGCEAGAVGMQKSKQASGPLGGQPTLYSYFSYTNLLASCTASMPTKHPTEAKTADFTSAAFMVVRLLVMSCFGRSARSVAACGLLLACQELF